ncbi:unnamed protein product [Meganyctiphanes norvegica]|uniref:C2H2-type domain-containing protein n=1 Tax=Meganyctiphanes norvegica TaxID=48144 RepID=A0AAV2RZX6_MEGNR
MEESLGPDTNYYGKKSINFNSDTAHFENSSVCFDIIEKVSPKIEAGYIAKVNYVKNGDESISADLPFTCSNCDFISGYKDELTIHSITCSDKCKLRIQSENKRHEYDMRGESYLIEYNAKSIEEFKWHSPKQEAISTNISTETYIRQKQETNKEIIALEKRGNQKHKAVKEKISPANPLLCHVCEYRTLNKYSLKLHFLVHSDIKPFACPECDYKCKRKSDLNRHKLVHGGDKYLKCTECDFSTARSNNLKAHMALHTGVKSYRCPICDYSSYRSDNLKSHLKTHIGERPYQCDECLSAFTTLSNLRAHVLIHIGKQPKNHKCDKCDYSCGTPSTLKNHKVIHSDEKAFECSECDYKCKLKQNLMTHMQTHSNEKPYKCIYSNCEYSSNFSSSLRKHILRHNKKDDDI